MTNNFWRLGTIRFDKKVVTLRRGNIPLGEVNIYEDPVLTLDARGEPCYLPLAFLPSTALVCLADLEEA